MRRRIHRLAPIVVLTITAVALGTSFAQRPSQSDARNLLLHPESPEMNRRAPALARVRMETTKGVILIELHREWSPRGVDRFYNLVARGYYNNSAFFRVIAGKWAQFGINGDPKIAQAWAKQTIPDEPRVESNTRGAVAFAFKDPNGHHSGLHKSARQLCRT